MKRVPAKVSTTNKVLPQNLWPQPTDSNGLKIQPADGGGLFIEVIIQAEVPETWEEAVSFYGGEEEGLKAVQQDIARRRSNAARPVLRDTETPLDWINVAQQAADSHKPGQRGGFRAAPTVDEAELRSASSMDDLLALLRAKGIQVQGSGSGSEQQVESEVEEESEDEVPVG
jgi:hypothetical protein